MHDSALSSPDSEANELTWREIVDHHLSSMVDELAARLDSDREKAIAERERAVENAVAEGKRAIENAVTAGERAVAEAVAARNNAVAEAVAAGDKALATERARSDAQLALACEQTRRSVSESLNQSLRRLRQATGEQNILQTLSESCAPYTAYSVVLVFENNQARVVAGQGFKAATSHGTDAGASHEFDVAPGDGVESTDLVFDIASAPAVISAIESRDPVVAVASETEISPVLAQKFRQVGEGNSNRKAYLFPVIARHSVVAMLIASEETSLLSAPIELLCEVAGMRLEALMTAPERPKPADLVQLTPSAPAAAAGRLTWDALSPEEQKLHLQAQRMARVRVAEMRLYHENELREGIASGNIYRALQSSIDKAREQFLQNFLARSQTMVDYLHLEILSSLAHDDDRVLGPDYPGPMV